MLDGVTVTLRGREFVVPPLRLYDIKKLRSQLATIKAVTDDDLTDDQIDAAVAIIHKAAVANYPELKLEEIGELCDVVNIGAALPAIYGISGLKRSTPGEAVSPKSSTGPASTDS